MTTSPITDAASITAFAPTWCLFWADSVKVTQLDIWLPYLRRSRHRFAIAASGDGFPASVRERVADLSNVAILEGFEAARSVLRETRGFRGFIYISTKIENFAVLDNFRGYLHVWVGHGDSGKGANAFRSASIYDSVFMANYRGIDRFPKAVRRWVRDGACAIGMPIVEGAVSAPWTAPRPVRTVLYAPTWDGYRETSDYSSIPELVPRLIDAMPAFREDGVRVIVRPHPATGKRDPRHLESIDALFAAGAERGRSKAADFADADVMIGDVSGVVGEFLFTRKPTIMVTSSRLLAIASEAKLAAEYPWVERWPVEGLDIRARLAGLATNDPSAQERERAADRLFRGHRSLEAAAATFDLALDCVRFRRSRIPPRYAFELQRRFPSSRRLVRAFRR